ncbi:MAG TPA: sensor histidine kinase [Chthoniobacterales bacterium]|jgi:signal transduction histidine kinase|nr:sensor histidine kinase [Chthoniobacterales bacterium]
MEKIANFLRKQSQISLFIEALVLAAAIGFVDYITGYEVTIFPFYSIPILLMVWFGNRKLAILMSLLCTLAWWWADAASGHVYSHEWLRAWDAIVRLMFFCLVMFTASAIKEQRDTSRARIELLERTHRLEQEIISISEREQQRIGRDLHDGVCQYLSAVGFTADMLKKDLEREAHKGAKIAGEIAESLQDACAQTRDLARGLSPVDRDEGALESALDELAISTSRLSGISCSFLCSEPVEIFDNALAVHLFRIAQEALNNASKHGHAKAVLITLESADGKVSLCVSDDGVGFDPARITRKGMGLNIMRYRARMIGGTLEVQSRSPSGTIVACTIERNTNFRPSSNSSAYE